MKEEALDAFVEAAWLASSGHAGRAKEKIKKLLRIFKDKMGEL